MGNKKKLLESFDIVLCEDTPNHKFLSGDKDIRSKQIDAYKKAGIDLFDVYDIPTNVFKNRLDYKIITDDWEIIFNFDNKQYKLSVFIGGITDGASIPIPFRFGSGTPHNQHLDIPSLVHDCLYASKYFTFDESNIIMTALMRWTNTPWLTRVKINTGVNLRLTEKHWNTIDTENNTLSDFMEIKEIK
jgi:hypothetical protein